MAKKTSVLSANVATLFVDMDWETGLPLSNPGRDDGESWGQPHAQIPPDLLGGWDLTKGTLAVHPIECHPYGKDVQKHVVQQRKARIAMLRENPDEETHYTYSTGEGEGDSKEATGTNVVKNSDVADFLETYVDTPAKYWVIAGQRRTTALPYAIVLNGKKDIPALLDVREFESLEETRKQQLAENSESARLEYSEVGLGRCAILMLTDNPLMSEHDLGESLGLVARWDADAQKMDTSYRGKLQRLFRLAKLALAFPALDVSKRLGTPAEMYKSGPRRGKLKYVKGGFLPLRKLEKEVLQTLLGRSKKCNPVVQRTIFDGSGKAYAMGWKATTTEVEKVFEALIGGTKDVSAASLSKTSLLAYLDNGTLTAMSMPVGDVLQAIVDGNTSFFSTLAKGEVPKTVDVDA